jgi:N,N'-diacetyllegionaminate synthase
MNSVLIIAEVGVNHNGSVDTAKLLIEQCVKAGADIVKFQTFKADAVTTLDAELAPYQNIQFNKGERLNQYELLKKLELSEENHREIISFAKKRGIVCISTPFDIESARFLYECGQEIFKIPSGEITNLPYLRYVSSIAKNIILSTGMSSLDEVAQALKIFEKNHFCMENITILHCTTEYPAPMEDVNLLAMKSMEKHFSVKVGYSDHTNGIEIPIAAVALGAKIIEKHITLDKNMPGPDHAASIEPAEFKLMVDSIRNVEEALGDGIKRLAKSEAKNINIVRKSIVAKYPIKKGDIFSEHNLTTKRPGTGVSPMCWDGIIGLKSDRNYRPNEIIVPNEK